MVDFTEKKVSGKQPAFAEASADTVGSNTEKLKPYLLMGSNIKKLYDYISRFINIKMGLAGALVMGIIVWLINYSYGWWPATTAAMKQAAYTFLFGGILIKILETICAKIKNRILAIIISTLVVSCTTIVLVYLVHRLKGTPYPEASTLPTIIMAPPGFLALAIRKRWKS